MAENNDIVEDVERVEIQPAGDGENVEDPNEADEAEEGAEGEDEGGAEGAAAAPQPEQRISKKQTPAAPAGDAAEDGDGEAGKDKVGEDGLHDVEGETPRERALRAELAKTRGRLRKEQGQDLGLARGQQPAPAQQQEKPELSQRRQELEKKFGPAAIANLKEVLPLLAEEMGFVKAEDLSKQSYEEQSEAVLQGFLDQHKEYLPENDKDGVLWNAFKAEFGLYNKPANPKDYQKIFNRVHTAIFGIKPAGDKGSLTAAQQKITVASHAGASGPGRSGIQSRNSGRAPGIRTDMLKGFTDEERERIANRAQGD